MKFWITKYALTTGILEVNGEKHRDTTICYRRDGGGYYEYAHGTDFHERPEMAIQRANEMRVAKIASLKKKITKLEKLTFEVKDVQS
jgi:hypothetical protein